MRAWEIFATFLRLGCTSFGGPVAHIGYFEAEFVRRKKWLDAATFAQIVALCQVLPGPASSQVGLVIGALRGGVGGAALAWMGFTFPSALALASFALGVARFGDVTNAPWIHGLLVAALAVVASAVATLYRTLCPDFPRRSFALAVASVALVAPPNGFLQLGAIAAGAAFGRFALRPLEFAPRSVELPQLGNRSSALACAVVYGALAIALPALARAWPNAIARAFGAFYGAGALVFGGGHVVLPLLEARIVTPGYVAPHVFLAGYGAAQAVPGPLFTFAAYLGAAMDGPLGGFGGAAVALFAIYLPSFLLLGAVLPYWNALRRPAFLATVAGINAAVTGLLIGACYTPVWTSAIRAPADVALALLAFAALTLWRVPPWAVVTACAAVAELAERTSAFRALAN